MQRYDAGDFIPEILLSIFTLIPLSVETTSAEEESSETLSDIKPNKHTHTYTFSTLSLVCKNWSQLIESEAYWGEMLRLYFPGEKKKQRAETSDLSNKALFNYFSHNADKNFAVHNAFYLPNNNTDKQKTLYSRLFALAKYGFASEFIEVIEQALDEFKKANCFGYPNYKSDCVVSQITLMGAERLLKNFLHARDFTDRNIINWAILLGHQHFLDELYQCLQKHRINMSGMLNNAAYNPFLLAIIFNQADEVKRLIEENLNWINKETQDGNFPLEVAAEYGHTELVKLLLEKGAHVNHEGRNAHKIALVTAAEKGHTAIVNLLLHHQADVNAKSGALSPLDYALNNNDIPMVLVLLEHGAHPANNNPYPGLTLLRAIKTGNLAITIRIFDMLMSRDVFSDNDKASVSRRPAVENIEFIAYLLKSDLNQRCGEKVEKNASNSELILRGARLPQLLEKWFTFVLPENEKILLDGMVIWDNALSQFVEIGNTDVLTHFLAKNIDVACLIIQHRLFANSFPYTNEILSTVIDKLREISKPNATLYKKINGVIAMGLFGMEFDGNIKDKMRHVLYYLVDADLNDRDIAYVKLQAYNQLMGESGLLKSQEELLANVGFNKYRQAVASVYRLKFEELDHSHFVASAVNHCQDDNEPYERPDVKKDRDYARNPLILFKADTYHHHRVAQHHYQRLESLDISLLMEIINRSLESNPAKSTQDENELKYFTKQIKASHTFKQLLEVILSYVMHYQPSSTSSLTASLTNAIIHSPGFCLWLFNGDVKALKDILPFNQTSELSMGDKELFVDIIALQLRTKIANLAGKDKSCLIS